MADDADQFAAGCPERHQQFQRTVQRLVIQGAESFIQQHIAQTGFLADAAHIGQSQRERQTDLETFPTGKILRGSDHIAPVVVDHIQFQGIFLVADQGEMLFERPDPVAVGQFDQVPESIALGDPGEPVSGGASKMGIQIFPQVELLPQLVRFVQLFGCIVPGFFIRLKRDRQLPDF